MQTVRTSSWSRATPAFYERLPIAHLEAGLRTGDNYSPFPEEVNRRLTTPLAALHLAPTATSRGNLEAEGIDPATIAVTGNTVSNYQKTGILVNGQVSAVVSGNTVTGYGPVAFIGQNGIQVSRGATARLGGNTISNNYYSPKSVTACGVIIYKAGGVLIEKTNTYSGNEKNVCTYGKGGTYSTA